MHCPDCGHILTPVPLGLHGEANQSYRCYRCGGFWIEPWLANRVSTKTLDKWPQTGMAQNWAGNGSDECPVHTGTKLQRFIGESVPQDLTIKKCRDCGWFWFPGNSLFSFKPAQEAKVNYYRLWNLPPAVGGLMLPVAVLLVLIGGGAVALQLVKTQQYALINASGVITQFSAVYLGDGRAIVSFRSQLRLSAIEYRKFGDSNWVNIIVNSTTDIYQLDLSQLEENTNYEFRIFGKIYKLETRRP